MISNFTAPKAVSYTHLDVYKRQELHFTLVQDLRSCHSDISYSVVAYSLKASKHSTVIPFSKYLLNRYIFYKILIIILLAYVLQVNGGHFRMHFSGLSLHRKRSFSNYVDLLL